MSSIQCEWCDGDGCDECQNGTISTMNDLSVANLPTQLCEWCEGTGCDECTLSLAPTNLLKSASSQLYTTSLQKTNSMTLPQFVTTAPISVQETDVAAFMAKRINQAMLQLWVSFDEAENYLRVQGWNFDKLGSEWLQNSAEIQKSVSIKEDHVSEPTAGQQLYLDPDAIFLTKPKVLLPQPSLHSHASNASSQGTLSRVDSSMIDDDNDDGERFGCEICGEEEYKRSEMTFFPCGHHMCNDCLKGYIISCVEENPLQSINLTCPQIGLIDDTKTHSNGNVDKCRYLLPHNLVFNTLREHDNTQNPPITNIKPFQPPLTLPTSSLPNPFDTTQLFMSNLPAVSSDYGQLAFKYRRFVLNNFTEEQSKSEPNGAHFLQCPSPNNCPYYTYIPPQPSYATRSPILPMLRFTLTNDYNHSHMCRCGIVQCVSCGLIGGHFPASCASAKHYSEITDPDALSIQLLKATTKECPKCNVPIMKDRYCNHVKCSKCSYDFCFQCKRAWANHSSVYGCSDMANNKLVGKVGDEFQSLLTSNQDVKRIMFFHRRAEAYQTMNTKFLQAYNANYGYVGSQHSRHTKNRQQFEDFASLQQTFQLFWFSCNFLYWTFATLSFLPRDSTTRVMRSQQALCLGALASLSSRITGIIDKKDDIYEVAVYKGLRDSADSISDYTERCSKAFVQDVINRKLLLEQQEMEARLHNTSSVSVNANITPPQSPSLDPMTSDNSAAHGLDNDDAASATVSIVEEDNARSLSNANGEESKKIEEEFAATEESEWSCTACGCIHVPVNSDLLFDDIVQTDGTAVLFDITEKRQKIINRSGGFQSSSVSDKKLHSDSLTQFKGVYSIKDASASGKNKGKRIILCANCSTCFNHGAFDCRVCFPR